MARGPVGDYLEAEKERHYLLAESVIAEARRREPANDEEANYRFRLMARWLSIVDPFISDDPMVPALTKALLGVLDRDDARTVAGRVVA